MAKKDFSKEELGFDNVFLSNNTEVINDDQEPKARKKPGRKKNPITDSRKSITISIREDIKHKLDIYAVLNKKKSNLALEEILDDFFSKNLKM